MCRCLGWRRGCPRSDSKSGCVKTPDRTGPFPGALVKHMRCILRALTSPAAWTFAVTLKMVDTLDSQSELLRMRTKFSCSGTADQRTFSISGSLCSILASCRDCSITRAKARILRRARNEEQNVYRPLYESDPRGESPGLMKLPHITQSRAGVPPVFRVRETTA
jgi:hypothetical protein